VIKAGASGEQCPNVTRQHGNRAANQPAGVRGRTNHLGGGRTRIPEFAHPGIATGLTQLFPVVVPNKAVMQEARGLRSAKQLRELELSAR
jgi:hypothetical protein